MKTEAPFGSWRSPVTLDLVTARSVDLRYSFGQSIIDGDAIYWVEGRPAEGRSVLVRWQRSAGRTDLTPPSYNVLSRVHEYGGGDFTVARGAAYFCNENDQRLYELTSPGAARPLTPQGPWRYADAVVDSRHRRLVCVREDHSAAGEPQNSIVAVSLDGTAKVESLLRGQDFYSSPRLSPDGRLLAWLSWNHPSMPWDGTSLWIGRIAESGEVGEQRRVAGGTSESIFQPEWSPDGILYFVSDRSGWWNVYRCERDIVVPVLPMKADFGVPQWSFGMSTYGFVSAAEIVCAYADGGTWHLASIDTANRSLQRIDAPFTDISAVRAGDGFVCFRGGAPTRSTALLRLDLHTLAIDVLAGAADEAIEADIVSMPQPFQPATDGSTARAFYYAPRNPAFTPPGGERPPLLVVCHGGPTGAASMSLDLKIQYWTSRGIGVVDVDYRGSSGYGRAYREQLDGNWGVADVADCVNAARFLATRGEADARRLAMRGASAGGYTVLCALTFHDVFRAGAVYYGVSDLEALARETHKFESRYTDRLIGPYPAAREVYRQRSPIHFVDRLSCPLIFFQGLDDKIVPPEQSRRMVDALRAKRMPVAYLTFAGEGHGFRKGENVRRALAAETYFYARMFGFVLADPVEPIAIENLSR